jgi:ribulose-1,5-bisphosphate 5-phosphatase
MKTIFFDLDNTLYPADKVYAIGLRHAWRAHQRFQPISWKRFLSLYDRARKEIKRGTAGTPSCHNRVLYFKRMTELEFGGIRPRRTLAMTRAYDRCWSEIDFRALQPLLKRLSTRCSLGIITNQIGLTQLHKLEQIDPEGRIFPVVVTSEEAGLEKPHPRIFREACRRARCRPSEAYMVGDEWRDDVVGARRVGMIPIYLNPGGRRSPGARRVRSIRHLRELLEIFHV